MWGKKWREGHFGGAVKWLMVAEYPAHSVCGYAGVQQTHPGAWSKSVYNLPLIIDHS
jgi:hypothetical protein